MPKSTRRDNSAQARRYAAREAAGICIACGKFPPKSGCKICQMCADRQATWRSQRAAAGLCTRCGRHKARKGRVVCVKCAKRDRDYNFELKLAAFNAYGGPTCRCCGETEFAFLQIDHVRNDGAAHRRVYPSRIYYWLKNNNYPKGFQVLCANCNFAKGFFGVCPHKRRIAKGRASPCVIRRRII